MLHGSPDLAPEEAAHLKLIDSLKPLHITPNEASLVSRLARFVVSPRVLAAMAAVPKWYARWEIREALFQNSNTDELHRERIGTSIAVIDLMRELDIPGLETAAREEVREDIRSLLRSLPEVDRGVVKAHARTLTAEAAAPASEARLGDVAEKAKTDAEKRAVEEARKTASPEDLRGSLLDPREAVRRATIENPNLGEDLLLAILGETTEPALIGEVATTPRWSLTASVRRAIVHHPNTPTAVKLVFETTTGLILSLTRYFNEPLEPTDKASIAKGILADIQELPAHEREYLKYTMGPSWPPFIREVTGFIEDDVRRIQPVPVKRSGTTSTSTVISPPTIDTAPTPPPAPAIPTVEPLPTTEMKPASQPTPVPEHIAEETFDQERHVVAPLHERPVSVESRTGLAHLPVEEREQIARSTANKDELGFLLHDPDDRVFGALLRNPAVDDHDIVAIARMAQAERVRRIVEYRDVYSLPIIKQALLHNPHTPQTVQLECLNHVSSPRELLLVMRDPKIRSLEVKAKARGRLQDRYKAMSPEERVAVIKQTGGELMNELMNVVFRDEATMKRLVQDGSLPENVLLKIVRSRVASRNTLLKIGRNPAFVNKYQIRLELALNPKSPRELVRELIPKLSPADRKRIKQSQSVANYVRDLA